MPPALPTMSAATQAVRGQPALGGGVQVRTPRLAEPWQVVEPGVPVRVASPAWGCPGHRWRACLCGGSHHQTLSCYVAVLLVPRADVSWGRDLHCSCLHSVLWKTELKAMCTVGLPCSIVARGRWFPPPLSS